MKELRVRITCNSLTFGFSRGSQMAIKSTRVLFSESKGEKLSGRDPNMSDSMTSTIDAQREYYW